MCVCVCVMYADVCAQSHPSLCDPLDCSPPGFPVHGILQARILEWVVMPSSRGSFQSRDRTHIFYVSCIGRHIYMCVYVCVCVYNIYTIVSWYL